MWWDQSRTAEVYLSRHRVRGRIGSGNLRSAETTDVNGVVDLLNAAHALTPEARDFRVWLSAGLCPALIVQYPTGIRTYAEHSAFATSCAATLVGRPPSELRIEFDPFDKRCVAVLLESEHDAVLEWAKSHGIGLLTLRPFWSSIFGPRLRAQENFALVEPDSISMLASHDGSRTILTCELAAHADAAAAFQRMSATLDDDGTPLQGLRYVETAAAESGWAPL